MASLEEVFIEIAKQTPTIGVLCYFLYYFKGEIKRKDEQIEKLNEDIRASQKDYLIAIQKLTEVINSLKDLINAKLR